MARGRAVSYAELDGYFETLLVEWWDQFDAGAHTIHHQLHPCTPNYRDNSSLINGAIEQLHELQGHLVLNFNIPAIILKLTVD